MDKTNNDELLNVQEVAMMVNRSIQTIASWYRWKKMHPKDELAKMLPSYVRVGKKKTRYWRKEDVIKMMEFIDNIPQGRNGKMGQVTQKYVKESKWNTKKEN